MNPIQYAFSALLLAAGSGAMAQAAAPAPDWTVAGNVGLFSEYRFRGIAQTERRPALQGGIDVSHKSGFYAGNWNSNVDSALYNGANLEMDFYGGYKTTLGAFGVDVGAIYYYYPGSGSAGRTRIDNTELYVGGSYGPASLRYYHATSDFFGASNTKGSGYLDLNLAHDLGGGMGLVGHVGHQKVRNTPGAAGNVTDWKIGATYDYQGYVFGASYIDTNRKGVFFGPVSGRDLGKAALLLSVAKTF